MGCVYQAYCVVNGKSYVGKTMEDLNSYKFSHLHSASYGGDRIFHRAIRKYGWDAFVWTELTQDDDEEWLFFMEQKWIKRLGTKVPNGYNMTDEGEGSVGIECSEETRRKRKESLRGKTYEEIYGEFAEEHRQSIGNFRRGRTYEEIYGDKADEIKAKIKISASLGKPSQIFKNMNKANKGRTYVEMYGKEKAEELCLKRRQSFMGKSHSEETRKKISEANTGRVLSDETKKKIGEASKGRVHSEETKKKMSETKKQKRARKSKEMN